MLSSIHVFSRVLLFLAIGVLVSAEDAYYGKLLGKLSELHHGVSGTVYAVDARTLHIRDLTYDGEGPDAFFYAGSSKSPTGSGFRIRDEKGTLNVLKRYRKKHVTLTLPEGKTLANIRWFSVWCREFSVNFGDVKIPKGFDFPKPSTLGALSGIHGVSSDPIVVVDAQTLLVPNFSYDGEAPDAKFWVGSGSKPSPQGIRVADENGRFNPLKKYSGQTLVITLPTTLTVHQIGHFGVWCEAFAVDFAHVEVPTALPVPPSLRMLGVSPQKPKTLDEIAQIYPVSSREHIANNSPIRRSFQQPDLQQLTATTYKPDLQDYLIRSQSNIQQSVFVEQQQVPPSHFYPHPQQAYYIGQQNNPYNPQQQQQQVYTTASQPQNIHQNVQSYQQNNPKYQQNTHNFQQNNHNFQQNLQSLPQNFQNPQQVFLGQNIHQNSQTFTPPENIQTFSRQQNIQTLQNSPNTQQTFPGQNIQTPTHQNSQIYSPPQSTQQSFPQQQNIQTITHQNYQDYLPQETTNNYQQQNSQNYQPSQNFQNTKNYNEQNNPIQSVRFY